MKKRIFGLLLALCMVVSLLPLAVFAEEPATKSPATFFHLGKGGNAEVGSSYQLKNKTEGVYWFTVGNYDEKNPNNTYTKEIKDGSVTDASESYIKLDCDAAVPTLTLKNVNISNIFGLTLGGAFSAGSSTSHTTPYNVVLIGENTIKSTGSSYGPLEFITKGDVTISGEGSLKLIGNKGKAGGLMTSFGNLTLDNTNISFELSENYNKSHGIAALGGNITVNGGKLTIVGWDNPKTSANTNRGEAILSALYASKDAEDKNGNITIKNGAKVTAIVSAYRTDAIHAAGTFAIENSQFELALAGEYDSYNKGTLFGTEGKGSLPTFKFDKGYTVVVSNKTAGTYDPETGVYTAPAEDKLTTYNEARIKTFKYFKVTEGTAEAKPSEPTETQPTETQPTETQPTETKPAESKPAETKPAESKPAESKPAETKPAESKPAETKPAESKPAETKPAETKPAETKPAGDKPTTNNPPTGDANMALVAFVVLFAVIAMAGVTVIRKKAA